MYPHESSQVLVYWLEGHNMLGWYMYIGLSKYIWLHDKIFLALAYPLPVWLLSMLFFYSCDDHQFMYENKCERYSWSTGKRWFRCIVYLGWTSRSYWAFLYGYGPCTSLSFRFLYDPIKLYNLFLFGHHGVPWVVRSGV